MTFDRTFFITTVTWQRTPLFRQAPAAELMMDLLEHYGVQKKYLLDEFVVMPDHLHLLFTPAPEISAERAVQLIKGGFSYRLGTAKRGLVWQESFTNHRVHDEQDYAHHPEHIRMNPVRAGLVEIPELYPYSSATGTVAIYPPCRRGLISKLCVHVNSSPIAVLPPHTLLWTPWKSGHLWPRESSLRSYAALKSRSSTGTLHCQREIFREELPIREKSTTEAVPFPYAFSP